MYLVSHLNETNFNVLFVLCVCVDVCMFINVCVFLCVTYSLLFTCSTHAYSICGCLLMTVWMIMLIWGLLDVLMDPWTRPLAVMQ